MSTASAPSGCATCSRAASTASPSCGGGSTTRRSASIGRTLVDDPDFDVDRHVHRVAVPSPGDRVALGEVVGDLVARRLDRHRPLWETWYIEGLAGGRVGLLTKIHHSLVDGVGGLEVATILFDVERQPGTDPEPPPYEPERPPSLVRIAVETGTSMAEAGLWPTTAGARGRRCTLTGAIALVLGALALAGTAVATWRVRRPVALAFAVMMTSWLVAELATFHLAAQSVALAALVALGALDSPVGAIGVAALAVSAAVWRGSSGAVTPWPVTSSATCRRCSATTTGRASPPRARRRCSRSRGVRCSGRSRSRWPACVSSARWPTATAGAGTCSTSTCRPTCPRASRSLGRSPSTSTQGRGRSATGISRASRCCCTSPAAGSSPSRQRSPRPAAPVAGADRRRPASRRLRARACRRLGRRSRLRRSRRIVGWGPSRRARRARAARVVVAIGRRRA